MAVGANDVALGNLVEQVAFTVPLFAAYTRKHHPLASFDE